MGHGAKSQTHRISSPHVGSEHGEVTVTMLHGPWVEIETDGGTGDPQEITMHDDEVVEMIGIFFKHRPHLQRMVIAKCLPGLSRGMQP